MVFRHHAAPATKRGHRGVEKRGEGADLFGRMLRAGTAHDHRFARGAQHRGRRGDRIKIRLGLIATLGAAVDQQVGIGCHRVPAHFDRYRPRPPAARRSKGAIDDARDVLRIVDADRILDDGFERRRLVGELMQMAAALAQELRWHLARQADER
jgi:hypothetical protein